MVFYRPRYHFLAIQQICFGCLFRLLDFRSWMTGYKASLFPRFLEGSESRVVKQCVMIILSALTESQMRTICTVAACRT